jgi:hypothetical protein
MSAPESANPHRRDRQAHANIAYGNGHETVPQRRRVNRPKRDATKTVKLKRRIAPNEVAHLVRPQLERKKRSRSPGNERQHISAILAADSFKIPLSLIWPRQYASKRGHQIVRRRNGKLSLFSPPESCLSRVRPSISSTMSPNTIASIATRSMHDDQQNGDRLREDPPNPVGISDTCAFPARLSPAIPTFSG